MLVLLLPLVVVGLAVLAAVAYGVAGRDVLRWAGVGAAVLAGVVLLAALGGLVLVRGAGDDSDEEEDAGGAFVTTTTVAETRGTTTSTTSASAPRSSEPGSRRPAALRPVDAVLVPREDDAPFPAPTPPLSGLADGDTIFVEAELERDGELRQCPAGASGLAECGAGLAVPAPVDGVARLLTVVEADLRTPAGTTDCAAEPCALVLFVAGENHVLGDLALTFGSAAPTPTLVVAGRGPFADGQETDVVLSGFGPGESVVVTQCTPPGPSDHTRCGTPAAEIAVEIGPEGSAVVRYPVRIGAVGTASRECRRGESCAIAVTGAEVPSAVVEISLAGSPGPVVPRGRAASALVAASLLALGAVVLLVRTDWRPPDGDPFGDMVLSVPPGWERLRDVGDDG